MVLTNIIPDSGVMRLIYSGGENQRDKFYPYFYAVSDNAEEKKHLIEQHPHVVNCEIEERFPNIKSKEKEQVVKVSSTMERFAKVIRDVEGIHGIKEIAETTIPHYYRYVMEKNLDFFKGAGRLEVKAMGPEDDIPKCDVLITFGGDDFLRGRSGVRTTRLGCFLDSVHIDVKVDMKYDIYNEGINGDLLDAGEKRLLRVMELSQMSGVRPDLVSRITPGKLNTFLHMKSARAKGYLVPDIKKEIERPKSLRLLQSMDKGGTIFYPRPGIYRNVAKCDFASMYPNIIVKYNITPECMHCECGDDHLVPEVGWRICNKRGIIPDGIEAVLKRRLFLKKKKQETGLFEYDIRQKALKNILVTCFGYLGFKNFVFSNVETKECVMLYGRHIMERTKEIAESMGLEVIYGIVDSVFVKNGTTEEYRGFVKRVTVEFGIELELDCIFESIAFPASSGAGVANKYYGITGCGEIEARGIALRHSDAPRFIKEFQEKAVRAILKGENLDETYSGFQSALFEKRFALRDLAITKSIRKSNYKVNAAHAVAYRKMPIGSTVTYVHTHYGPVPLKFAKMENVNVREYLRLLEMKKNELLGGLVVEQ
jgi:DNA polymerase elongation subunit (family B)